MFTTAVKKRVLTELEISQLNAKYQDLTVNQRIAQLYKDFEADEVMLTSSFAATSAFLLHAFSQVNKQQKTRGNDTFILPLLSTALSVNGN